jgi:hypothetical protein
MLVAFLRRPHQRTGRWPEQWQYDGYVGGYIKWKRPAPQWLVRRPGQVVTAATSDQLKWLGGGHSKWPRRQPEPAARVAAPPVAISSGYVMRPDQVATAAVRSSGHGGSQIKRRR